MSQEANARGIGIRYGVWVGLGLIFYGFVYRVASLDRIPGLIWVFYVALPLGVLIGQIKLRKELGVLTLKQGLTIVVLIILIAGPIYCFYVWGFNQFIDDSLLDQVVAGQREALAARGLSGEALEEQVQTLAARLTPATFALFVLIRLVGFGLITGALISLLTKTWGRTAPQTAKSHA